MAYDVRLLCEVEKKQTADNDGGEPQERSFTISSSDCLSVDTAEGKAVQNQPNASETSTASDQPNASRKKKMKSDLFKKFGRYIING